MPRCEECQRDFSTEQGLAQHTGDKHGATKHDKDKEKKIARAEQRSIERGHKAGRRHGMKKAVIIGILILLIAIVVTIIKNRV